MRKIKSLTNKIIVTGILMVMFLFTTCDNNLVNKIETDTLNLNTGTPGITVSPTTGLFTSEDLTTTTFELVLTSSPSDSVTIPIFSKNTLEGTVDVSTLTFTPKNWSHVQVMTITGVDDFIIDGNQPYIIQVDSASSTDTNYDGLDPQDVSVTNTDNDAPSVNVTPASGLLINETGTHDSFYIVLATIPSESVTIPILSSDTGEGTVFPSEVVFNVTNWNTPEEVTITGIDDSEADGNQNFTIFVQDVESNDSNYNGYNPDDVYVTNIDDDTPGITVSSSGSLTVSESGSTDSFSIVLNSKPTADVTIGLSTSDLSEGSPNPASLTFTTSNWSTQQTVTINPANDDVDDDDRPFSIVTSAAVSGDENYNGINPDDVSVTNIDDDTAGFVFSGTSSLSVNESGTTDSFSVKLSSEPTGDVSVSVTSSDTTEGAVNVSSLTFTSGSWNTPKNIVITGIDDPDSDGSVTFHIILGSASSTDSKYKSMNPSDPSVTNAGETRTVATPSVSPATDTYSSNQTCSMSCSTLNANIYYTVSNTSSDPVNPTASSSHYTDSISLIKKYNNIKVRAYYDDWASSGVVTRHIYIPYICTVLRRGGILPANWNKMVIDNSNQYLYIGDAGHNKIMKFQTDGTYISGGDITNINGLKDMYLSGNDLFISTSSCVMKYSLSDSPPTLTKTFSQNIHYASGVAYDVATDKVFVQDDKITPPYPYYPGIIIYDGSSAQQTGTFPNSNSYSDMDYISLKDRIYLSNNSDNSGSLSVYGTDGTSYGTWNLSGDYGPCNYIASFYGDVGLWNYHDWVYYLYAVKSISSGDTVYKYNWDGTLLDQFDVHKSIRGIAVCMYPLQRGVYLITSDGDILRYNENNQ